MRHGQREHLRATDRRLTAHSSQGCLPERICVALLHLQSPGCRVVEDEVGAKNFRGWQFPLTEGNRRRADVALPGSPNALCEWGQRNFGLRGSLGRDEDDTQATLAHAKA